MTLFPLLGIDVGPIRCGIALSDPEGLVATPLEVIRGPFPKQILDRLPSLIETWGVKGIVVGIPKRQDGTPSHSTYLVKDFIRTLSQQVEIPVYTWDERYSTKGVERSLIEQGKRRKKRKEIVDAAAAAWILQGYLEYCHRPESRGSTS